MTIQEEIRNAVPLPSSPTRMPGKQLLLSSCSILEARFVRLVRLKERKQGLC